MLKIKFYINQQDLKRVDVYSLEVVDRVSGTQLTSQLSIKSKQPPLRLKGVS